METNTKERIKRFCDSALITKEREDKTKFKVFNEDTEFKPYWERIENILYSRGFEIEDFYYRVLDDALSNIGYYLQSNEGDLENFEVLEYAEADIYNGDLLAWLSEDLGNSDYVEDVLNEIGDFNKSKLSFFELLQHAQTRHKEEIYYIALEVVKDLIETFETEEEDRNTEEEVTK